MDLKIITPKSEDNPLLEILVEKYENYEIIWHHWKYDGPKYLSWAIRAEDFEPIIITYDSKGNALCVTVRRAWKYITYKIKEDKVIIPITILFHGEFHHPFVKNENSLETFNKMKKNHEEETVVKKMIDAHVVPLKYRTGKKHLTNIMNVEQMDPTDYVKTKYD